MYNKRMQEERPGIEKISSHLIKKAHRTYVESGTVTWLRSEFNNVFRDLSYVDQDGLSFNSNTSGICLHPAQMKALHVFDFVKLILIPATAMAIFPPCWLASLASRDLAFYWCLLRDASRDLV